MLVTLPLWFPLSIAWGFFFTASPWSPMKDSSNLSREKETQSNFLFLNIKPYSMQLIMSIFIKVVCFDFCFHICRELLRGPLYYVLILILCALVFWRESPVGLISLAMMCGGDGNSSTFSNIFTCLLHILPYNHCVRLSRRTYMQLVYYHSLYLYLQPS